MMKQPIKTFEQAIGKTVESTFEFDGAHILVFTDDTYASIRSDVGYDGERVVPELSQVSANTCWEVRQLIERGFCTQSDLVEVTRQVAEREAAYSAEEVKRELQQLAVLKAKYG